MQKQICPLVQLSIIALILINLGPKLGVNTQNVRALTVCVREYDAFLYAELASPWRLACKIERDVRISLFC